MTIDVMEILYRGQSDARDIVGLRLADGTEITSDHAIAMMQYHGENYRYRTPLGWRYIGLVHRKVLVPALAA